MKTLFEKSVSELTPSEYHQRYYKYDAKKDHQKYLRRREKILQRRKELYAEQKLAGTLPPSALPEYDRKWRAKMRTNTAWLSKTQLQNKFRKRRSRLTAMLQVAKASGQSYIACVRCGCFLTHLLEFNHKNTRLDVGRKLMIPRSVTTRNEDEINAGRADPKTFEITCRPCNAIHFLESKFQMKLPLRVTFDSKLL